MDCIQMRNDLRFGILALWLLALFVLFASPSTAQESTSGQETRLLSHDKTPSNGERRIALVIGNGAYQNVTSLKNPANDAALMAVTLRTLGFTVAVGTDRSQLEMKKLIREFGRQLRSGGGVGLFYFAGHGVQSKGRNFLIPVDANIETDADLEDLAVNLNFVLEQMEDAQNRLNIAILDACRNNPFPRSLRSAQGGLAQVRAPSGTLIAYSTAPDRTAADGSGKNSPYTEELSAEMQVEGVLIETIFRRVAERVSSRTRGGQEPWFSANIKGEFCFRSAPKLVETGARRPRLIGDNAENKIQRANDFNLVNKKDCAEIELFLQGYPGDFEASLYQLRLNCKGKSSASLAAKSSADAESYITLGLEHYRAANYDQVILDCNEAIKRNPQHSVAYTIRGVAYFQKDNYDQGILDFTEAIKLNPQNALAYVFRARAYLEKNNHDGVIADSTAAIRIDPTDEVPYLFRGLSYFSKNNYDRSIEDCTMAIELNPKYDDAYLFRGAAYRKQGKVDNAIADTTTIIKLNPRNDKAYILRGMAREDKKDCDSAIIDYTEAIRLGGVRERTAYRKRAGCYAKQDKNDDAIADYTEAIRLGEKDAEIYSERALAYHNQKNHDQAIADFSESLRFDSKNSRVWLLRGINYYYKESYSNTIYDCTQAIIIDPDYMYAYHFRALAYEKLGEKLKAEADRQKEEVLEKEQRKP